MRYDGGRYQLGKLAVQRNKQNDATKVVFEPVPEELIAEAQAKHLDFTNRVNPEGTVVDFGKIVTDGSVKVQKTADLKLGEPSALKLVAKAALTQADMGEIPVTVEGEYLVFKAGLKGAGRYELLKK